MTDLKKPVRRRTVGLHRGRRIMVSLEPGDVLGLRQERCRQTEYLSLPALYDYAVKSRVLSERAAKQKARKNGR